ncbi:RlpA-like double-psi beta-barrel domain-containing protein [Streptomyces mayteni]
MIESRVRRSVAALAGAALLAACGGGGGAGSGAGGGPAAERSADWLVTVYYTAVESYHDGESVPVTGCPRLDCAHGTEDLGDHPTDFVAAVRDEGTGRLTTGPYAGRYLNWSHDTGYWLDVAPRDSYGRPLEPFVSAAADGEVLPRGRTLRVADCGTAEDGSAIEPDVCARLTAATWEIRDEFTPGLGGERHLDVYLGEETGPGFTADPLYTTLAGATLDLLP